MNKEILKEIWLPVEKLKQQIEKRELMTAKRYNERAKSNGEKYTYFILDKTHNAVKIGYSRSPIFRFDCFQNSTLNKLKLLKIITGNHERQMHQKFKTYFIRNEWFRYSDEIQVFIRKRY